MARTAYALTERPSRPVRWTLVLLLAAFATVRVGFGALSYPLFGHLDELSHLDTVLKYDDRLGLPLDPAFEAETAPYFALHNSPEYAIAPGPEGPPPRGSDLAAAAARVGSQGDELARRYVEVERARLAATKNHQAYESPFYYWIAAGWLRAARDLGVDAPRDAYALRLLGALCLGLAVVLAHIFVRECGAPSPAGPYLSLGVPALIACWPQDVYSFINNDHLSIVLATATLILFGRVYRHARDEGARSAYACYAIAGLALGASVAHKSANAWLFAATVPLLWPWLRAAMSANRKAAITHLATIGVAAATVLVGWRLALHARTGFWSGAALKCDWLGVSDHDLGGVLAHPIWSLDGAWTFVSFLVASFWRGEIQWHGELLASPWLDVFWIVTSALCIGLAILTRGRLPGSGISTAMTDAGALAVVAAGLAHLYASVAWDYGPNMYPSRDFPYLVSGRLSSGLAPVAFLLYALGLERLMTTVVGPLRARRLRWVALAVVLATLLGSDLVDLASVARSSHNFWHLDD